MAREVFATTRIGLKNTTKPARATFEAAVVLDEVVEVLDLHPTAIPLFPRGGAVGDVPVGVEFFDGDGDGALTAVLVFVADTGGQRALCVGTSCCDCGSSPPVPRA